MDTGYGRGYQKSGKKFFGKINRTLNGENDRLLFAHGVHAFESMRLRDKLSALDKIDAENVNEFIRIVTELDNLEAYHYYCITQERLMTIRKLKDAVDTNSLEEVFKGLIFDRLWLLDPSWDHATSPAARMEQTVKKEFEKIRGLSEEEERGRMDIRYRKTSGVHVIIELKRASVKINSHDLSKQVEKYQKALRKCIGSRGTIETVCVLGQNPSNWETPEEKQKGRESLRTNYTRIITYEKLIDDAERAYADYLKAQYQQEPLQKLMRKVLDDN